MRYICIRFKAPCVTAIMIGNKSAGDDTPQFSHTDDFHTSKKSHAKAFRPSFLVCQNQFKSSLAVGFRYHLRFMIVYQKVCVDLSSGVKRYFNV